MANESAEFELPPTGFNISMDAEDSKVVKTPAETIGFDQEDLEDKAKKEDDDVSTTLHSGTGDSEADAGRDAVDQEDTEGSDSGEDGEGEEGSDQEEVELGAFDPEDEESVSAYDGKYLDADGDIDLEGSLSAEYWANVEAGKEGLNEDTYAYLKSKGIKESTIKQVEAMAKTQKASAESGVQAQEQELFTIAGGPDELGKALKWGKEGGYDDAAQKRFNTVAKGTDFRAKQDAVEALMARYRKANPAQKPRLPKRDATKGQGQQRTGIKGFADRAEARKVRDALRADDTQGWANYNRRRAASGF